MTPYQMGIGNQRGKKASLMEYNREALTNRFLVLFSVLLELSLFGLFSRATVWLYFPLMPSTSGGAVTYSNIDVVGSAVRGREGCTELKTNRSEHS